MITEVRHDGDKTIITSDKMTNLVYVMFDGQLYYLKYQLGETPEALNSRFSSPSKAIDFFTRYEEKMNWTVGRRRKEIKDRIEARKNAASGAESGNVL